MSLVIALLLLSVLTNSVSQLSLKRGIMALQGVNLRNLMRFVSLVRMLTNPYIMIWAVLVVLSMLLWLKAISIAELSFAYPFLSLNLVFICLGSVIFLRERITGLQWAGIAFIVLGVIMISSS